MAIHDPQSFSPLSFNKNRVNQDGKSGQLIAPVLQVHPHAEERSETGTSTSRQPKLFKINYFTNNMGPTLVSLDAGASQRSGTFAPGLVSVSFPRMAPSDPQEDAACNIQKPSASIADHGPLLPATAQALEDAVSNSERGLIITLYEKLRSTENKLNSTRLTNNMLQARLENRNRAYDEQIRQLERRIAELSKMLHEARRTGTPTSVGGLPRNLQTDPRPTCSSGFTAPAVPNTGFPIVPVAPATACGALAPVVVPAIGSSAAAIPTDCRVVYCPGCKRAVKAENFRRHTTRRCRVLLKGGKRSIAGIITALPTKNSEITITTHD